MSFLLHRDACAAALRNTPRVGNRILQHAGQLDISAVTVTVLEMWLTRARTPTRYLQVYRTFLQRVQVLPIDDPLAHRAASIGTRFRIQKARGTLPDCLVAATALVHNLTLVTRDTALFNQVPGLAVVDWTQP